MESRHQWATGGSPGVDAIPAVELHDPASLALRAERAADIRAALARLDEPYREVVALRFFDELSLAEIAVVSGRPLGTVKTHLRRGLLKLRRDLADADVKP